MSSAQLTNVRRFLHWSLASKGLSRCWAASTTATGSGEGQAILYTYGPDADALLGALRSSFADFPVGEGAYAMQALQ